METDDTKPRVSCEGPGCGRLFVPSRQWAKFCSNACRQAFNRAKAAAVEAEKERKIAALEEENRQLKQQLEALK